MSTRPTLPRRDLREVDGRLEPELLRLDQVAALLQLGLSTIYKLVEHDQLRVVRIGRAVRVRRADLQAFIAQRTGPEAA